MQEKYDVCCALFHGFDRSKVDGGHSRRANGVCFRQLRNISSLKKDGKDRFLNAVRELSQAFALAVRSSGDASDSGRCGVLPGGSGGIVEAGGDGSAD